MNRMRSKCGRFLILLILSIPGTSLRVFVSSCYNAAEAAPAEPIRELWRRPMAGAQCLAVAPDGSRCALVTWRGEVVCWVGARLGWRRPVPGAEAVVLGRDGSVV